MPRAAYVLAGIVGYVLAREARRRRRRRAGALESSAVAGRRDWTRETLAAGVREGDRRALARAITLVENGDPLAYGVVADLYPATGNAYAVGITGPPGVGKSSLISALVRHVRAAGVDGRRRLRRPVEPVLEGRAARRPHPSRRPLPRPRRVHPLDGHARPSRRSRRGDLAGAARPRRGRQGSRLPRDGRRGAERGGGDRHRRHRRARAHARLGRLGAGVEGGDHGDPRRDRDQQDGSPGREDDAERGALDPRARP